MNRPSPSLDFALDDFPLVRFYKQIAGTEVWPCDMHETWILHLRFVDRLNLEDIAPLFKSTREDIRQIELHALSKLEKVIVC